MESRRHLAQKTGVNLGMIICQKHNEKPNQDDDIPGDDDDDEPARNHFNDGKGYESSEGQEFIGNGIEVCAQFGPLVSQTGDQTVQSVRDPCDRKSEKSPFKIFVNNENNKDWSQQDSD